MNWTWNIFSIRLGFEHPWNAFRISDFLSNLFRRVGAPRRDRVNRCGYYYCKGSSLSTVRVPEWKWILAYQEKEREREKAKQTEIWNDKCLIYLSSFIDSLFLICYAVACFCVYNKQIYWAYVPFSPPIFIVIKFTRWESRCRSLEHFVPTLTLNNFRKHYKLSRICRFVSICTHSCCCRRTLAV